MRSYPPFVLAFPLPKHFDFEGDLRTNNFSRQKIEPRGYVTHGMGGGTPRTKESVLPVHQEKESVLPVHQEKESVLPSLTILVVEFFFGVLNFPYGGKSTT